jgi:hypothetical protein
LVFRLESFDVAGVFPILADLFGAIKDKTCSHDAFAVECKQGGELLDQVVSFSKYLFTYSPQDSLVTIVPKLEKVSKDLNIQIHIYRTDSIQEIKKNRYVDPLVVSIFETEVQKLKYYTLYHTNYKEINPSNCNTSNEYFPDTNELPDLWIIEGITKILLKELKNLSIDDSDQAQLKMNMQQLIHNCSKHWIFEEDLMELCK